MTAQPVENPVDEKPADESEVIEPTDVQTPGPDPEIEGLPADIPESAEVVTLRSRDGKGILTIDPNQTKFTDVQRTGLRSIGIETEGDDAVPFPYVWQFLHHCQKTELDPWLNEIYLITHGKRWVKDNSEVVDNRKFTVVTGIGGFRKKAEETGQYVGQIGPQWAGDDGIWKEFWNPKWGTPVVARVGILRRGFDAPVWGVAMYDEFVAMVDEYREVQKQGRNGTYTKREKTGVRRPNEMWTKMPANQIAKCAEAQGFRKAFPRTMAGMYEAAEMSRAHAEYQQQQEEEQARAQRKRLEAAHAASKRPEQPPAPPSAADGAPVTIGETAQQVVEGLVVPDGPPPPTEGQAPASGPVEPDPGAVERLRGELEWQATVKYPDHAPDAGARLLAKRAMVSRKKDLDAFEVGDLLAVVAPYRPHIAGLLREAGRADEAARYAQVSGDSVVDIADVLGAPAPVSEDPRRDVDPNALHDHVGPVDDPCQVCDRFRDELPHPRSQG